MDVHLYRAVQGVSNDVPVGQRCDQDVYPDPLARSVPVYLREPERSIRSCGSPIWSCSRRVDPIFRDNGALFVGDMLHGLLRIGANPIDSPTGAVLTAAVVDRYRQRAERNASLALFLPEAATALLAPPANVLRARLRPDGMALRIANLGEWRGHPPGRLRRQLALTADAELDRLYDGAGGAPTNSPFTSAAPTARARPRSSCRAPARGPGRSSRARPARPSRPSSGLPGGRGAPPRT